MLFVDDQIYQELPDFVVATVDKYAMVPWRGEAGMLNIEVGVLLDDARFAAHLARQWLSLVEADLVAEHRPPRRE